MKFFVALAVSFFATSVQAKDLFSPEAHPEEYCLALNVYHEARGSSYADQIAVADVVLNRVQDRRYPNTVCEVVKQGKKLDDGTMKRHACQFSWYCDGKSDKPLDKDSWAIAQEIAYKLYVFEDFRGLTEGATHYHADYVSPKWARSLHLTGTIGSHMFYRWD